jgi:hypothetical protein
MVAHLLHIKKADEAFQHAGNQKRPQRPSSSPTQSEYTRLGPYAYFSEKNVLLKQRKSLQTCEFPSIRLL